MKIERLEIVPYALRFREPYVTARGLLRRRELVLVRLHAGGAVGLGEAAPLSLRGGADLVQIVDDLERICRPLLEGAKLSNNPLDHLHPCRAAGASSHALLAMELALLDHAAKQAGMPVWKLLDGRDATPVRCNATLTAGAPGLVAEQAIAWARRGFTTFKLKLGTADDVDQVAAVRDAVGADAKLRVDANEAWSEDEAIEKLRVLERYGIELAEQPVKGLEGLARVRRAVSLPIAADESINTLDDAQRATATGACDLATVKLAKVGSIRAAFDIANELPVYLSSALDGPVGIAAAAHVAQTLPRTGVAAGIAQGLATAELFDETIASRECRVINGAITPGVEPGLGVEIDEHALERSRI